MTFGGPGSWIARVDELRAELELERWSRRAERRATIRVHGIVFDYLEEIGHLEGFHDYFKRAKRLEEAA